MGRGYLIALALLAITGNPASAIEVSGKPHITDADTFRFGDTRVRLHGIDAPETRQECQGGYSGKTATEYLQSVIGENVVTCKGEKFDRYNRLIGVCYLGDLNLNAQVVQKGHAFAYRKYSTEYVALETYAKTKNLGVWKYRCDAPWDWRRNRR